MAELEFAGLKFKGGKIVVVLTALGTLLGGAWGAFEFYKDYLTMKQTISEYVAPDLSGFDKGRYDSANQLKTLIVMQVLGNSKSFFDSQKELNDIEGFFTDQFIPDAELTTNNIAQYFLFAGSDGLMNEMVMQQWQK